VCVYKRSTGYTHKHTDREQHPRHTHTHDTNTTPNPQTSTRHKHLSTLAGGALVGGASLQVNTPYGLTR